MENRKIVRTRSAGVYFGHVFLNGTSAIIKDARRLWHWSGAASLSQLAVDGVSKPLDCKFPVSVSEVQVFEVIEVLTVTEKAGRSIDAVAIWKV
jgi:hypothetical protein